MLGFTQHASDPRNGYASCSGCGLCQLVCPVWRKTHDLTLTPHGRAKALQHSAAINDIAASIEGCTLCGACEPVCPEEIDLVGMVVNLRRQLPRAAALPATQHTTMDTKTHRPSARGVLLAGAALRAHAEIYARAAILLEMTPAEDDGSDIAIALETGAVVPKARLKQFLEPLHRLKTIVAADGLLLRHLRNWLPRVKIVSLGAALSRLEAVRRGLRATDLYVIEPRAYHADHARLVRNYDHLRVETGCTMNLDLQRIAIPATARNLRQRLGLEAADDSAQTRWLLHRLKIQRIVAESVEDMAAFKRVCDLPVVHIAELAEDEKMKSGMSAGVSA